MKKVFHASKDRGEANYGWLKAKYSFSFSNYTNPERTQFGVLCVLNDDIIAPGMGFGSHPHDNMEIITIPLSGSLKHQDSMNNLGIVKQDEIQVMSTGTGIFHSEFNNNKDQTLCLLQIWVLPKKRNVSPRYDQMDIKELKKINSLYPIITPDQNSPSMWIHQDAWFHLGDFDDNTELEYKIKKKGNGVYSFVIHGSVVVAGKLLGKRDALGIWDTNSFILSAEPNSQILLIEVPLL